MFKKTLRFYFQTRAHDNVGLKFMLALNNQKYIFLVDNTEEWCSSDDVEGAVYVDCNHDFTEDINVSIQPLNGDLMLVGICENSIDNVFNACYSTIDIVSQPLINGQAVLTRYDIAGHYAGGNGGGDFGPGNFPLYSNELGEFVLRHQNSLSN